MSVEIRIPKLGMSMQSAILQQWLVANGAAVIAGQPIYVVESDKSTTEIESPATGTLRVIGVVSEQYEVGALVGTIE